MKSISFALAVMVAGTTVMPMSVEAVEDSGYSYVNESEKENNDTETSNNVDAVAVFNATEQSNEVSNSSKEENQEAKREVSDHGYSYVNKEDEKYRNEENSNDKDAKEMTDAANRAKEAAEEASKMLDAVNQEVEKAEEAAREADTAANNAQSAVEPANKAAGKADAAANNAQADAKSFVEDAGTYNDKVTEDQKKINNEIQVVEETLTVTVVDEENQEHTKTLDEYVEEKKNVAEEAAKKAHDALGEALAIDADEATADVVKKVDEVKAAAEKAQKAADEAKAEYDKADAAYWEFIKTYDHYAMMYNLPLYGKTEITYTDLDVRNAGITSRLIEQKTLESQRKDILNANLEELGKTIESQADTIKDLSETVDAAQKAAVEAQEVADKLVNGEKNAETGTETENETVLETKGLKDYVKDVNAAYREAADHYVKPAKKQEEEAKKELDQAKKGQEMVNAEQNAIIEEQEGLKGQEQDKVTAKEAEKKALIEGKEYKDSQNFIEKANKKTGALGWGDSELEKNQKIIKKGAGHKYTQEQVDAAKAYVAKYEEAQKYVKDTDAKVKSLDEEIAKANANITDAENKIAAANNVMQSKQNEVDVLVNNLNQFTANREAAEAVREQYVQEIQKVLNDENEKAKEELIEAIKKELEADSLGVNQVEFDRDLNAWANEWWQLASIDAHLIRDYMNDEYATNDKMYELINHWGLTQWIAGTEKTEKVMELAIEAYRKQMKENEERLATIEAYLAKTDAEETKIEAGQKLNQLLKYVKTASDAEEKLDSANAALLDAQITYNTAKAKLEATQNEVANVTFNSITLADLMKKIDEATAVLEKAGRALLDAQNSAQLAENYNNWAQKLISDQYTNAYAQKTEEGLANSNYWEYDMTDEGVQSQGSGNFVQVSDKDKQVVIPYEVYRSYLTSLYNKYPQSAIKETYGKGISTGGSMQVVYWLMDENDKLTGEYTLDENALISGKRYFIAYALKVENDGYHMDGYVFDFTRNEEVIPGGNEENGGSNANGGNGGTIVGGGTLTPAVLGAQRESQPITVATEGADVLGATREKENSGDVLGATRAPETTGDVLGENRPQTGDDTNARGAAAGAAVSGLLLAGYMAVKKKETKTEEQC